MATQVITLNFGKCDRIYLARPPRRNQHLISDNDHSLLSTLAILPLAPHNMAIIEDLGLEVNVQVDGSATAEYPDEEPDDHGFNQTTKTSHHYVESIDNAEFAIHVGLIPGLHIGQEWVDRSRDHRLSFLVAFDGGPNITSKLVQHDHPSLLLDGIANHADQTLSKFRFAPVSTGRLPFHSDHLKALNLTPLS